MMINIMMQHASFVQPDAHTTLCHIIIHTVTSSYALCHIIIHSYNQMPGRRPAKK